MIADTTVSYTTRNFHDAPAGNFIAEVSGPHATPRFRDHAVLGRRRRAGVPVDGRKRRAGVAFAGMRRVGVLFAGMRRVEVLFGGMTGVGAAAFGEVG